MLAVTIYLEPWCWWWRALLLVLLLLFERGVNVNHYRSKVFLKLGLLVVLGVHLGPHHIDASLHRLHLLDHARTVLHRRLFLPVLVLRRQLGVTLMEVLYLMPLLGDLALQVAYQVLRTLQLGLQPVYLRFLLLFQEVFHPVYWLQLCRIGCHITEDTSSFRSQTSHRHCVRSSSDPLQR